MMSHEQLISVIVPVYHVEKYLDRCIESIVNQTYKCLEIILVDDGSADRCPQMCDEWKKRDSRIIVVHKKNGGLSDARNAGLNIAHGEYICFIDSDDWIGAEMLERMLITSMKNHADIVECNVMAVYSDHTAPYSKDNAAVYASNVEIMEAYIKDYSIKTVAWNKLYEKSVLNGIRFETGKYHEDEFFTYRVLSNAHIVVHLDDYFYFYRQRDNSIMNTKFSLHRLDALEAAMYRNQFINDHYPMLRFYSLLGCTWLCIGLYQLILRNPKTDKDKNGRKYVSACFKKLHWTRKEYRQMDARSAFWIALGKCSLPFCSWIRNLVGVGG